MTSYPTRRRARAAARVISQGGVVAAGAYGGRPGRHGHQQHRDGLDHPGGDGPRQQVAEQRPQPEEAPLLVAEHQRPQQAGVLPHRPRWGQAGRDRVGQAGRARSGRPARQRGQTARPGRPHPRQAPPRTRSSAASPRVPIGPSQHRASPPATGRVPRLWRGASADVGEAGEQHAVLDVEGARRRPARRPRPGRRRSSARTRPGSSPGSGRCRGPWRSTGRASRPAARR